MIDPQILEFGFSKVPAKVKIPIRRRRKETRDKTIFKLREIEETRKPRA